MAGGRLIDKENEIKALIEEGDLDNPLLFKKIYDLIRFWFLRTKKITDYSILDDVAMIGAEMLYLKIYNGGSIYSWLGYISIAYQSFIREYKKLNSSEIFDATNDPELADSLIKMSTTIDNRRYQQEINDRMMIDSLPKIIDEVMEDSRYQIDTKNYVDARLVISLSILKGSFISIFMDNVESNYTKTLYNRAIDKIKKEILRNAESDFCMGMSISQLYALEETGGGSNNG